MGTFTGEGGANGREACGIIASSYIKYIRVVFTFVEYLLFLIFLSLVAKLLHVLGVCE